MYFVLVTARIALFCNLFTLIKYVLYVAQEFSTGVSKLHHVTPTSRLTEATQN